MEPAGTDASTPGPTNGAGTPLQTATGTPTENVPSVPDSREPLALRTDINCIPFDFNNSPIYLARLRIVSAFTKSPGRYWARRVTLWLMANSKCQQHTQTEEDQPSSNKNTNALPPGTPPRYQNLIFGRNKTYETL